MAARDGDEAENEEILKKKVESGDYFRSLASALDLTAEIMSIIKQNTEQIARSAKDIERVNERNIKKLQSLRDDLEFLRERYKIVAK